MGQAWSLVLLENPTRCYNGGSDIDIPVADLSRYFNRYLGNLEV